MECGSLLPLPNGQDELESGGKPGALHTLREIRQASVKQPSCALADVATAHNGTKQLTKLFVSGVSRLNGATHSGLESYDS
jgi:hypothetical protein